MGLPKRPSEDPSETQDQTETETHSQTATHEPGMTDRQTETVSESGQNGSLYSALEVVQQRLEGELRHKEQELDQLAQEFEMIKTDARRSEERLKAVMLDNLSLQEQLREKKMLLDQTKEELRRHRANPKAPVQAVPGPSSSVNQTLELEGTVSRLEAELLRVKQELSEAQNRNMSYLTELTQQALKLEEMTAQLMEAQQQKRVEADVLVQDYIDIKTRLEEQVTENMSLKFAKEDLAVMRQQLEEATEELKQLRQKQRTDGDESFLELRRQLELKSDQLLRVMIEREELSTEAQLLQRKLEQAAADLAAARAYNQQQDDTQPVMTVPSRPAYQPAQDLEERMAVHAHLHRCELDRRDRDLGRVRDELDQVKREQNGKIAELEEAERLNARLTSRLEQFQMLRGQLKEQFERHKREHQHTTNLLERAMVKNKALKRELLEYRSAARSSRSRESTRVRRTPVSTSQPPQDSFNGPDGCRTRHPTPTHAQEPKRTSHDSVVPSRPHTYPCTRHPQPLPQSESEKSNRFAVRYV